MPENFKAAVTDRSLVEMLVDPKGIDAPQLASVYTARAHDPGDLDAARRLAGDEQPLRLGLFYSDPTRPRYEETRHRPLRTAQEKITLLDKELDRYAV
jgi:hypothetical protein